VPRWKGLAVADAHAPGNGEETADKEALVDLLPMVRKVVGSRIRDPQTVEDLVQETLLRVMAARKRVDGENLAPYAAVTARNLVATFAEKNDRARDHAHLLVEADANLAAPQLEEVLRQEDISTIAFAMANLAPADQDVLMAHEVEGVDTKTMAAARGSTPGAVAAHLNRARARLRVEYLLAAEHLDPPSDRCRPILRAVSLGDQRRQRELDAAGHLLACDCCAGVSATLLQHRASSSCDESARVAVARDADVVAARRAGREVAARVGFSATDQTVIATAISEVARNIVKFAERGTVVIDPVSAGGRDGLSVVARDVGPGIPDPERALQDGYSTYHGLGLGLPGARRLMDRLEIVSVLGEGTTVLMEKWL
jgi:RNA polymerase sigma factor (sigma-70 family)